MKTTIKTFGFAALAAVIVFSSCGGDSTPNPCAVGHTADLEIGLCTVCGSLTYNLGDTGPGGGKIVYRSAAGFTVEAGTDFSAYTAHYLEGALVNQGTSVQWGEKNTVIANVTNFEFPTNNNIGKGRKDTQIIVAYLDDKGIFDTAAHLCAGYSEGKSDWFLPSLGELNEMYKQRAALGIFDGYLWSSSQFNVLVWIQNFGNGVQYRTDKDSTVGSVRAVRAF